MAIRLTSVKCPECGAILPIEEGRTQCFCSYCGAKVIVTNENEYIYRHVDEAKIKRAEVDKAVQLRKLEIIEKKRAEAAKVKKIKIIVSIVIGIIAVIMLLTDSGTAGLTGLLLLEVVMFIWIFSGENNKEDDSLDLGDKVKVPTAISDYESKSYTAVEAIMESAGFTNIRCVPLNDLTTGFLKKPGIVESITINGREITSGKKYPSDAFVVISYHSFSDR